jgi:hypothetical protein
MSWFSRSSDQPKDTTFGYNLEKKNTVTEIREVGKKLEKTTTKYIGELDKYKEIQKFNKQLTKGYIANLDIMVDVSKLLNMYLETFELIRTQVDRAEKALGKPLDAEELSYLAVITKENIQNLAKSFLSESGKLQGLFSRNPEYQNEAQHLAAAQNGIKETFQSWASTTNKASQLLAGDKAGQQAQNYPSQNYPDQQKYLEQQKYQEQQKYEKQKYERELQELQLQKLKMKQQLLEQQQQQQRQINPLSTPRYGGKNTKKSKKPKSASASSSTKKKST